MVAGFCAFAALVLWLSPTAGGRDAAELTASAAELGIAHPTGFVLDLLIWRVLMLVPLGDLGFRAALTTALWGAASVALITQLAIWIGPQNCSKKVVPLLAPALLLGSATVLRSFTETEVYASALCLSLLAITAAAHPSLSASVRWRSLALLAGVSFLTHTSLRIAIVAAGCYLLLSPERRALRLRTASVWAIVALSTVALVLYIPLRARHMVWADWGSPTSASAVLNHLSAARIRQAYSQQMFATARIIFDLKLLGRLLVEDLGLLGLLGAALGTVFAVLNRQRTVSLIVWVGLGDFLYALLVNPMGARDRQTLFLAEASLALLASYFAASVLARLHTRREAGIAWQAVVAACAVVFGLHAEGRFRGSVDGWSAVELYGGPGAIGAVAPRAIVLCESDDLCGGSLYARVVEGERPDVVVLPRQHLWERSVWRRLTIALGHPPNDRSTSNNPEETLRVRRLRTLVSLFRERIRWEQGDRADEVLANILLFASESPVLAQLQQRTSASENRLAPSSALNNPDQESVQSVSQWLRQRETPGALSQQMIANVLFAAGMRHAAPNILEATPFWQLATQHDPQHAASWSNLAVIAARRGRTDEAIVFCERSLAINPQRAVAWRNLRQFAADRWTPTQLNDLSSRAAAFGIQVDAQ